MTETKRVQARDLQPNDVLLPYGQRVIDVQTNMSGGAVGVNLDVRGRRHFTTFRPWEPVEVQREMVII